MPGPIAGKVPGLDEGKYVARDVIEVVTGGWLVALAGTAIVNGPDAPPRPFTNCGMTWVHATEFSGQPCSSTASPCPATT